MLKDLSSQPKNTKGRFYDEIEKEQYRTIFERDRDRIIHSSAFRKLKQKTQVFIESESDYYRTRLTHTLEVSQIARSLSRALDLNEDLSECISLAHDLGHPPFGHNGEKALNKKMLNYGGFNHNIQTLRVVTFLEKKYPTFDGLNLSWESLEGIVKHNGKFTNKINSELTLYNKIHNLFLDKNPSLEAQVAAISDDIAYNNHDIDDAIRANLINIDQLYEIEYFKKIIDDIRNKYGDLEKAIFVNEIIRTSIKYMVEDIINETCKTIQNNSINTITDIQNFPKFIVSMSNTMHNQNLSIKKFLLNNVYNHKSLMDIRKRSEEKIICLFDHYNKNFSYLPIDWKEKISFSSKERIVCDYIAGMTDTYALKQYKLIDG